MAGTLEKLIADINKNGLESVRMGVGTAPLNIRRFDVENLYLAYLFRGGMPDSVMYELYGNPSCGKSVLAYFMLACWQKMPENKDRYAAIFDNESTHDDGWAATLGVDMSRVILWQPKNNESAEELFDIIIKFADTGDIGFMILDSIGSLVPKARKDKKSFEEKTMGGVAAALTDFVNDFNSRRASKHITFVAINQMREDFDNQYSKGRSPGGKAFKHHCGIRLVLSDGDYFNIKGEGCSKYADPAGFHIIIVVEKNKVTVNDRKRTTLTFRFVSGIDCLQDNVDFAVAHGYIGGAGAWYEVTDYETGEVLPKKINGLKNLYSYFQENPSKLEAMVKHIMNELKEEK